MKSIWKTLYLSLFLVPSTVFSQGDFGWGIDGGLSYSSASFNNIFSSKDSLGSNLLTGYNAGLVFDLKISEYISLQPEIRYNQRETETDTSSNSVGQVIEKGIVFNRIQIPLLFKFEMGYRFKIAPFLGPVLGINLRAFEETRSSTPDDQNVSLSTTDLKDSEYNMLSYENLVGFMLSYKFSKTSVVASYRYPFEFYSPKAIRASGFTQNNGASINVGLIYYP